MVTPVDKSLIAAASHMLSHATQDDVGADFQLADLRAMAQQALSRIDADTTAVAPVFGDGKNGHDYARQFVKWREQPPAMSAVLLAAADALKLDAADPAVMAAALASFAADVPLNNAYHDNSHFREVTTMMAVYCKVNQHLATQGVDGVSALSSADMAKCVLAAMGHDLLHNGGGNTVDGVHQQYRLEDRAIAAIDPFMKLAGMSDADRAEVATMIRVTDVSAPKGGISPHKVLRKLMAGEPVEVPPELQSIAADARLRTMAALMSDADLAPSAATNYITSRRQLHRVSAENPALPATDQSLSGFLSFVVEKEFTSPAARHLSQGSLDDIVHKMNGRLAVEKPTIAALTSRPPPKP